MNQQLTITQKRETLKIAKKKVEQAQQVLLEKLLMSVREGVDAPTEAKKAHKALRAAEAKEREATLVVSNRRKQFYEALGLDNSVGKYSLSNRFTVKDEVPRLLPSDARSIENIVNPHKRTTTMHKAEQLHHTKSGRATADKLEYLQEFIDIELPTDLWLDSTDAYKALTDLDARIIGIIED